MQGPVVVVAPPALALFEAALPLALFAAPVDDADGHGLPCEFALPLVLGVWPLVAELELGVAVLVCPLRSVDEPVDVALESGVLVVAAPVVDPVAPVVAPLLLLPVWPLSEPVALPFCDAWPLLLPVWVALLFVDF